MFAYTFMINRKHCSSIVVNEEFNIRCSTLAHINTRSIYHNYKYNIRMAKYYTN
jgi:hypothetical protein